MELNEPIIIGLNMVDVATQRGIKIKYEGLMRKLKVPVFPIVARKGKGTEELLNELSFKSKEKRNFKISYGKETEDAIKQMTSIIQAHTEYPSKRLRFIAIQYLLDNPEIERELPSVISEQIEPIKEEVKSTLRYINTTHIEIIRNQYIDRLLDGVVEYRMKNSNFN